MEDLVQKCFESLVEADDLCEKVVLWISFVGVLLVVMAMLKGLPG